MSGTRRVALRIGGAVFDRWERMAVTRSLEEISGGFELDYLDAARALAAFGTAADPQPAAPRLTAGDACRLELDGEPVLDGFIDEVRVNVTGTTLRMAVAGRDRTGDLVDCAAAPDGPAEYRNLTILEFARRLCAPFGVAVRAETDVGTPLPVLSLDVGERVMEAIEKAARQRALLVASDGAGGLVLTRGGNGRAPAALALPGNVVEASYHQSWRERFRDYRVVGQTRGAAGTRLDGAALALTPGTAPAASPAASTAAPRERAGIVMTGRARDEAVGRHRPTVAPAKTQSGGATVQAQAEWMRRVARGKSERASYQVLDWRAGPERRLWRPNELVAVSDPLSGIAGDMLIASCRYAWGPEGAITTLEVVGPEAFDLLPEEERQRARERARPADGRALPITAGPVAGAR